MPEWFYVDPMLAEQVPECSPIFLSGLSSLADVSLMGK
jgi:hypothetical protein